MTQLGGTTVQSSAPEVRDIIEKGVADAVTFPWGSIPLFGIDKVTKYHMDVPLYATTFACVFNKAQYETNVRRAERRSSTTIAPTSGPCKVAGPVGRLRACRHARSSRPIRHTKSIRSTGEQLAEWTQGRGASVASTWADERAKSGGDPDADHEGPQGRARQASSSAY